MSNQLKRLHDELLAIKPDDASHDSASCDLCRMEASEINEVKSVDNQPEGGSMSEEAKTKTFSEDELKAAVAQAVADATSEMKAKLAELQDSKQQSDIDKAVADVTAESEETIKELQSKLDAAVLEAQTEKTAREDLEASIEAEKVAATEAAALEAKTAERVEKVKEVAAFADDYIAENSDRWARMSDEEFTKSIEDWKVIASKSTDNGEIPTRTAMTASREESGNTTESPLSYLGDLRRDLVGKNL